MTHHSFEAAHAATLTETDSSKDPVCGMTVSPDSQYRHVHDGHTYLFCSAKCMARFQASPADYLDPRPAQPQVDRSGLMYTCQMHPEIRQSVPGACPKCGMALEEISPAAAAAGFIRPIQFGAGAFVLLLAVYFGVVSLISGTNFALEQFAKFWYFIVLLALGFGIQVGLYTYIKNLAGQHGASGKVVAVSGTTSTAAMVSCCAHYLANIL
ncbi:MAG: YHS domain-containing protein, partial [Gallionella sp.]|nr:YHS domain-containing protein [Gallionella sp.]